MEWINIKDSLPNDGQECLVCCLGDIFIAEFGVSKDKKYHSFIEDGEIYYCEYWMPLPEPPKEK